MGAATDLELLEDIVDMGLNGAGFNPQLLGDVPNHVALSEQAQDQPFRGSQMDSGCPAGMRAHRELHGVDPDSVHQEDFAEARDRHAFRQLDDDLRQHVIPLSDRPMQNVPYGYALRSNGDTENSLACETTAM